MSLRKSPRRPMARRFAPRAVSSRPLREVSYQMSAYVISELEVRDAVGIETYRTIAAKSIAQYGGRYLVRGGAGTISGGGAPPKKNAVREIPSTEKLRERGVEPEYAATRSGRS